MFRLARLALLLALVWVWFLPPQPRPFEVTFTKNVMVAMRDGVKLAADIYQPARNGAAAPGKFPALLTRTPYNKDGASAEASAFAAKGYVVLVQDVRGRYQSEGRWVPIRDDPNDG